MGLVSVSFLGGRELSSFVGSRLTHPSTHPFLFARYCSHRKAMLRGGGHPGGVTHVTGRLAPR